jgi:CubicO group peptidase (beta-lactamase class C family)
MRALLILFCAIAPAFPKDRPDSGRIAARMREMIAGGEIPGAVTLVATRDGVAHFAAAGKSAPGRAKMRKDGIFWIASMTKPITGTAILMLEEDGKLDTSDAVSKYIPEFAALATPSGKPANLTLRHLMTHTSGLAEATAEESGAARTLADLIPSYLAKPMKFEPGAQWAYCQSGINTLGRIVEIASGMSYPDFLERRIFAPLGMKDTTFYLRGNQLSRWVKPVRREQNGTLAPAEIRLLGGKSPTSTDRYPAANGGLFSTAADYARFARMILNNGSLDGRRYLKPESVRKMTTIHTGDLKTGFTPGNGWGLTWCVVREPQGITAMLSPGTHGHGGAYGTQAWIDPARGVALILMVQRDNFANSDASPVRLAFQEAAAAHRQ